MVLVRDDTVKKEVEMRSGGRYWGDGGGGGRDVEALALDLGYTKN